ncbi:hypothetical protein A1OO_20250 [Enterovibrio norvegicus FF-33]|uniref:tyrosine-type recombinase/integrase n=1 Tax=Enterovibrio norvegicus TaxID=188144 RepID=UPI0002E86DC6|nr:site-specific integrase [Enterovibrio norvegicus]OEE68064.1 hypothetical protein A1OO_20250 [Enterovibrio norvegicus FF-33]
MESVNFRLASGQKSYALYINGEPVYAFNRYINDLARTEAANTVKSKASDLRIFFAYLDVLDNPDEITELEVCKDTGTSLLTEIVLQFPLYLSMGRKAPEKSLAALVAGKTNRKPTSNVTNQRVISSVRGFLKQSAKLQAELQSASEMGVVDLSVAPDIMFGESLFRQSMPRSQRKALLKKSLISGVCRNGARLANSTILKTRKSSIVNQERGSSINKALPHEDVMPVLSEAKTMRDRLFISLALGTGLREIEAANILLQDIDVKNKSIRSVNPLSRPLAYGNAFESFHGETAHDMAYKGRSTDETFFIEPFRTIFFRTLRDYLELERKPLNVGHSFLFVVLRKGETQGRPLSLCSDKTRQHAFKQALTRVYKKRGLPKPRGLALHSLRHFYGVYCLNYLCIGFHKDGTPIIGLDLNVVQHLMGHANISATEVYAVPDTSRVMSKVLKALNMTNSVGLDKEQKKLLMGSFGAGF